MDILRATGDWARAELLSNGLFLVLGAGLLAASFGLWQAGRTDMARAFIAPTLVGGALLVLLGGGLMLGTWKILAGTEAAVARDPAGFVAAEIARADRTIAQYRLAVFRVLPLLIAAAALLTIALPGPSWRAAAITAIIVLGSVMAIDSTASARLSAYRAALAASL